MDILTEGLQKKENRAANENGLQKCKTATKDDYKNVKNSSWKKNIFYSAAK